MSAGMEKAQEPFAYARAGDFLEPPPGNDTRRIAQMNVSLRPLEDGDLDTIYQQVTDPESIRMAAFTAADQTDRRAFLDRTSRLRADPSVSHRVIEVDGVVAGTIGSFRIDDQLEVTYWVGRAHWGKGIASAALQIFLPRLPNVRCTPARPRTTSVRFECWRRLGSDALASTAASHAVAVRRSRRRSCASTEVGRTGTDDFRAAGGV